MSKKYAWIYLWEQFSEKTHQEHKTHPDMGNAVLSLGADGGKGKRGETLELLAFSLCVLHTALLSSALPTRVWGGGADVFETDDHGFLPLLSLFQYWLQW